MITYPTSGEARRPGRIEVVCGSMFSGKTEELIRRLRRAQFAKQKVEIFKPAIDTRYSDEEVVSHDHNAIPSTPLDSYRRSRHRRGPVLRRRLGQRLQRTGQPRYPCYHCRSGYGLQGHTLRADACALRHCRRCHEGTCHLRQVRLSGLCQPPHCTERQARTLRRDTRV